MKLFNAITAAAIIGTAFITHNPAQAENNWPEIAETNRMAAARTTNKKGKTWEEVYLEDDPDMASWAFDNPEEAAIMKEQWQYTESVKKRSFIDNSEDCALVSRTWNNSLNRCEATEVTGARIQASMQATDRSRNSALNSQTNYQQNKTNSNSVRNQQQQPSSRCPAGTSYAHIKIGGLLFKKTLFKGCGTPSELAHWRNVSSQDMNARWKNFGNALQKAGEDYNRSVQNSMGTRCTTNFIGSTAYTNCY